MSVESEPANQSMMSLLLWTTQGRMLLGMGVMYTVIVSLTLAALYTIIGLQGTATATVMYEILTSVLVYFRAPKRSLIAPALVLFTVIPVAATVFVIAVRNLVV